MILVFAIAAASLMMVAGPAFAPCHVVIFVGDPYGVGEGAGKVTITVSNGAGGQLGTFTVDYATASNTAKAGSDFKQTSGTLQLPPGQAEGSFQVPIINDTKHESTEDFMVKLSNGNGCNGSPIDTSDTASVIIQDNDPKPKPSTSSTPSTSPRPTSSATPTRTPTATKTASLTASPSPSPTPTPTQTQTAVAVADESGGGLSGGALAGIVAAVVVLGGAGAFVIRRRFLT
ncbi:MAG: Calx-beta domain-containing protein [Actinomycetota bacterium]